jgi:hypothetical protein
MATSFDRLDLFRHVSLLKQRDEVQKPTRRFFVDQDLLNQHSDNLALCFELLTPFLSEERNGVWPFQGGTRTAAEVALARR